MVLWLLFSAVASAQNGSIDLTWTPPTQNTDGSTLTNLAGTRIVYGTSATALDQMVQVPGASVKALFLDHLAPAKYYLAAKAYASTGAESELSNVVTKTIIADAPQCTSSQPADLKRTQVCAAGSTGSWPQTQPWYGVPYPACWALGAWAPLTAPAGACVLNPPTTFATVGGDAYRFNLGYKYQLKLTKVGVVAAGSPCQLSMPAMGLYVLKTHTAVKTTTGAPISSSILQVLAVCR